MTGEVLLLSAALLLAAAPIARAADCTEPPAPGVDWQRCSLDRRDLAGQKLAQSRLSDASFERAELSGADLAGVNATHAKFISAVLHAAMLDGGNFAEADF